MILDSNAGSFGTETRSALKAFQYAVNSAAIVTITDKRGIITYANEAFCEVSRYHIDELVGNTHKIINSSYHPKSFFQSMWRIISSGKVWRGEIKNKAKDGSFFWVDTTISPIYNTLGKITHHLCLRSLITERKALEIDHEKLLLELTHKYNDLMQFNYTVSHNLRGPIGNIKGLIQLVKSGQIDTAELVEMVGKLAESMDQVISDLTRLLSVHNTGSEHKEEISLNHLLSVVRNSLSVQIQQARAEIKIALAEEATVIYSVKAYIQSVLYNLISNALKYRKDNVPPVIRVDTKRVERSLVLVMSDNGTGMDLEAVGDKLFGLYKRFDQSKDGRGIGLYLVKSHVETLGGTISVDSKPGEGTSFTITLPDTF
ncbi:ATP-binding protein [Arcticibacter sp. MXS-1]|uniref:PAS domain-containing sensor histidine kinase n=1 Tax=Arcticibacter sp. MXS-1 TaxID=3341726 RepID=UPI0035A962F3